MSLIPPQMPNIRFTTQTLFIINLFGRRFPKMWIPHSDFSSTTQGWSHQNTCFFDQLTRISLGCSPSLWKGLVLWPEPRTIWLHVCTTRQYFENIIRTEKHGMVCCCQNVCKRHVWTYLLRSVLIVGQGGTECTARARQCHWTSSPRCHQHSGAQNRYQVCLAKPL